MSDSFYRSFEDRYRGTRDDVKSRLRAYIPFIDPLRTFHRAPAALDLGCGRGEWLELMQESGFVAHGVDLDEGMLASCLERGLSAAHGEAIGALRGQPAESFALVSAFHLIEHMPFEEARTLISEALRVLQPGGLLILETPNPENLMVGASSFYLDPSHVRPIPPELLAFVVEYAGFQRHKVLRLNEAPDLHAPRNIGLLEAISGSSPDYCVIGQKAGPPQVLSSFDSAFGASYGIESGALVMRYEQQRESRFGAIEDRAGRAESRFGQAEHRVGLAEARLAQAEASLRSAEQRLGQAEARLKAAEEHAGATAARLAEIFNSYTWRIPHRAERNLRSLAAAVREGRLASAVKRRSSLLLRAGISAGLRSPVAQAASRGLDHAPEVKSFLKRLLRTSHPPAEAPRDQHQLSPRASRVFQKLKQAVRGRKP